MSESKSGERRQRLIDASKRVSDERFGALPLDIQYAYWLLACAADGAGRMPWTPEFVAETLTGYTAKRRETIMAALVGAEQIVPYTNAGLSYAAFRCWHYEQRSLGSVHPKYPAPPPGTVERPIAQTEEGGWKPPFPLRVKMTQDEADALWEVLLFYRKTLGKNAGYLYDLKRQTAVLGRLREGYTVRHLKAAIVGQTISPFHNGENEQRAVYDDIELICRSSSSVDRFTRYYMAWKKREDDATKGVAPPRDPRHEHEPEQRASGEELIAKDLEAGGHAES